MMLWCDFCFRPAFLEERVTHLEWESFDEDVMGGMVLRETDMRAKSLVTASEDGWCSPSVAVVAASSSSSDSSSSA